LTRREVEVLAAMADGASNKAIARRLGISFHTVKFHIAAQSDRSGGEGRTTGPRHALISRPIASCTPATGCLGHKSFCACGGDRYWNVSQH
jgi:Bacterial regulatory proteins, luxR family